MSMGFACSMHFLKAIEAAILKAISDESTSWYDPSNIAQEKSVAG